MATTRRSILASGLAALAGPASAQVGIMTFDPKIVPGPARAPEAGSYEQPGRPTDLVGIDRQAGKTQAGLPDSRGLWMINPEIGEEVLILFYAKGHSVNAGYTLACRLLRDQRAEKIAPIDPLLLHMLWHVQRQTGFTRPVLIHSGYQTAATAQRYNAEASDIASYHTASRACDFSLDGISQDRIVVAAQVFGQGGLGFYSDHIHLDTGPVRQW